MVEEFDLSERHTCRLGGLSRDSYRHPPAPNEHNVTLKAAIIDIAQAWRRFSYRRIHDLLRSAHKKRESQTDLSPVQRSQAGGKETEESHAAGQRTCAVATGAEGQ
jgi:hypothetical protein